MRRLYDVVTVKEAAALKGVSEEAVRKRIERHVLPAEKVGGVWLIKKAALDAWDVQRKRRDDPETGHKGGWSGSALAAA